MRALSKVANKGRFSHFHWVVLAVIVALIAIGLLNLRNADYYSNDVFHERQLKWYLVGLVVAILVSVIDLSIIERLSLVFYGIGLVLLVAVLFTDPINNSRRWLPIFGEQLQPSEFMKIFLVLSLARVLPARPPEDERPTLTELAAPHLLIFVPVILIFAEPDLGTAIIVTLIGFSMIFFEGVRVRSVLTAVGVVALVFPLAWKFALHDYHKARVLVWWDAEGLREKVKDDPELQPILDKAYQPEQAVMAIGSGEFWGKGGRKGHATRQSSLPFLHTDFVVATWGEERGFVGCTIMLALYYVMLLWCLRVTRVAKDRFQALVAVGVCATIFWQFFVNVGMVTGLLPVVGVALPLLSYGGSSVISICMGLGLLFNIQLRARR